MSNVDSALLKGGYIGPLIKNSIAGCNALELHSTVGVVKYKNKHNLNKLMLIDAGLVVDWSTIEAELNKFGGIDLVTHILLTHQHNDHMQNVGKFDGRFLFMAGKTSIIGQQDYGGSLYKDGYIEVPEIRYEVIEKAHTRADTVYLIDNGNAITAFLGDLLYTHPKIMSMDQQMKLAASAGINFTKCLKSVGDILKKNSKINSCYLGHYQMAISRAELLNFV